DSRVDVDDLPPTIVAAALGTVTRSRERRKQLADDLYQALISGEYDFWNHVQALFLNRDITRHDLRETIQRGLRATGRSYRRLMTLFHISATDYKRFLNFLAAHDCRVDFREFRYGRVAEPDAVRLSPPPPP